MVGVVHREVDIAFDDRDGVLEDRWVWFVFFALYFELLREIFNRCEKSVFEGLQSSFCIDDAANELDGDDAHEVCQSKDRKLDGTVLFHEDTGEQGEEDSAEEAEGCGLPVAEGFSDAYFLFPVRVEHHYSLLKQGWKEYRREGSDWESDDETYEEMAEALGGFSHGGHSTLELISLDDSLLRLLMYSAMTSP